MMGGFGDLRSGMGLWKEGWRGWEEEKGKGRRIWEWEKKKELARRGGVQTGQRVGGGRRGSTEGQGPGGTDGGRGKK
jgi:hypothetical protein